MIGIDGTKVTFTTKTLAAVFTDGVLTELKSIKGEEFISAPADFGAGSIGGASGISGAGGVAGDAGDAYQLVYPGNDAYPLRKRSSVYVQPLNDHSAFICIDGWYGEGVIKVEEDLETGDLLVTPSVTTKRGGLRAIRFIVNGIREDLRVVAPLYQGVNLALDDPLLKNSCYRWPIEWDAGLIILQGEKSGFWIHTQDRQYRYKALRTGLGADSRALGFDTEAYGPIDHNKCAGGITWRFNVYEGGWQVPAERYRSWLFDAYNLHRAAASRPDWLWDINMAILCFQSDMDILDALAKKTDPSKTLLKPVEWRTDKYDQNYPRYIETESAAAFMRKAKDLGFHAMPHMNALQIDPLHEDYYKVEGFELPDIDTKKIWGWVWDKDFNCLDVPKGATALRNSRESNTMVMIHPGLSKWRSMFMHNIKGVISRLDLDCVYIDQTSCIFNNCNCLVENTTTAEGMNMLIHQVAALNGGIAVCGENLNEITFQGQSLATVMLYNGPHQPMDGVERTGGCDLGNFLFGSLCRTYGGFNPELSTEDARLIMRIYREHGSFPEFYIRNAEDLRNPYPFLKEALKM